MSTHHFDLYAALGLNPSVPAPGQAEHLDRRIAATGPLDDQQRELLAIARAILGDPGKKAHYDHRLSDLSAAPVSRDELRGLASAPVSATTVKQNSIRSLVQQYPLPVLGGVAVLAIVLVVAVLALTTSGSDDMNGAASTRQEAATAPNTSATSAATITVSNKKHMRRAMFLEGATKTMAKLQIVKSVELSPGFKELSDPAVADKLSTPDSLQLYQFQDRSIGVKYISPVFHYDPKAEESPQPWAYERITPDLKSTDARSGSLRSQAPSIVEVQDFDLALQTEGNAYFNIQGADIPEAAKGVSPNQVRTIAVKPDAFDEHVVWVTLRGSTKLYKTEIQWL